MDLERQCMDCGKTFIAVVDDQTHKVLNGDYWGKLNPNECKYSYVHWVGCYDKPRKISKWAKFWGRFFDWVDGDEEWKCNTTFPKRLFLILKGDIMLYLDRKNRVELWSCNECKKIEDSKMEDKI